MIDWSGRQQILLLCQSFVFGAVLGMLFSVINVLSRVFPRRRGLIFAFDVLFFVFSSFTTFFFALAQMDGRLHPLLFLGISLGFATLYFTTGRYLARGLSIVVKVVGRNLSRLFRLVVRPLRLLAQHFVRFFDDVKQKIRNVAKNSKKINIFSKKT